MRIRTRNFGEIDIDETKVIYFPSGLLGFEEYKRYILLANPREKLFKWLQCVDEPGLCFLVIEPVSFMFNYTLEISDEDTHILELERPEDALIYAIVVVPEDPSKISANLTGPVVINSIRLRGKQVISTDPNHRIKHYILEEMKINAEKYLKGLSSAGETAGTKSEQVEVKIGGGK